MQIDEVKRSKYHLIFIVAGIAIAFIVIGVAGSLLMTTENQLRENAEREVLNLTEQGTMNIVDYLTFTDQTIKVLTAKSADFEDIQPTLRSFESEFDLHEVSFIDIERVGHRADGTTYFPDEVFSDESLIVSGVLSPVNAQWAFYQNEEDETICLMMEPLELEGKVIGYIQVQILLDSLLNKGGFSPYEDENFFMLLCDDSRVTTTASMTKGNQLPADIDKNQLSKAIQGDKSTAFINSIDEANYIVSIVPISENSVYVCSVVSEESVRSEVASIRQMFEIVFGIILVCLLMVLLMSFFSTVNVRKSAITKCALAYMAPCRIVWTWLSTCFHLMIWWLPPLLRNHVKLSVFL